MTEVNASVALDEFGQMAKARLIEQINEYNALAKVVKAAEGDPAGLLDTLRTNSDDETVKKYTQAIEDLDKKREELWAKRDEILKPIVDKEIAAAKEGSEAKAEALKALGKKVKSARNYLADTYSPEALNDLPALEGKRGGAGAGSTGGSGARRIRGFDFFIDGNLITSRDAKGNESSNAAAVAKHLGVSTEDVRQAFWTGAGTDDSSQYPPEVEFTLHTGEGDERKMTTVLAKRAVSDDQADS